MNEEQSNPKMEQKCPQCGAPLPSGVLEGLCPTCLMKQGATAETGPAPEGAPFQPPGVAEVARLFPQLEILSLIGKGGMGAVYQARQPALDRKVALKILPPQTAAGPGFVERFNREARALAKLNHPNIVAVYEFGQANGLPYFIMEFVDGLNLRELERAGKLTPREALKIVPQICEALQFAHDEGIVHRDIKPENILLDKKGRVKIADFGIAKILTGAPDMDLTSTRDAIGTPHYMAPEQMEKPTTVDHRADIFSLGVVFYEMLTGELPLGKFAPPSSRKVEVDVRLDDVVLRALEKDPARRYQHASQVKTAVDTIVGTAAPPPNADPGANAAAMAQAILGQDYTLHIRSCLKRGWRLLKGEFWPMVGITALVFALLAFAGSFGGTSIQRHGGGGDTLEITSAVEMLVWGPLMGGLWFYFLKKVRMQPATVETAFCGFGHRFLHLFLAGFVTSAITWISFLLVLPGIYFLIAWGFTLPLVIDKGLDFWSAMELSRKVVTKHWFKFFGFALILLLLALGGLMVFIIGIFIVMPLLLAAQMYAYDDIFGGALPAPATAAAAPKPGVPPQAPAPGGDLGPGGTVVVPPSSTAAAPAAPAIPVARQSWSLATKLGLTVAFLFVAALLFLALGRHHAPFRSFFHRSVVAPEVETPGPPASSAAAVESAAAPAAGFGDAVELELAAATAIDVASNLSVAVPKSLLDQGRGPERDSAITAWMDRFNLDFAFLGAYDGFYSMTRDLVSLKRDNWDEATPAAVAEALHDGGVDVPARFGDASRLNNPTNWTYGFLTRQGMVGLMQVTEVTVNPPGVKVRYKLAPADTNQLAAGAPALGSVTASLADRLNAAMSITAGNQRDQLLSAIAVDAAKAGDVEIVKNAVTAMLTWDQRDQTRKEVAILLAKRGLRARAIDLAKGIGNRDLRNQTLAELAR